MVISDEELNVLPQKQQKTMFPSTSTVLDDGAPSESCYNDATRVLLLIEDERHLLAQKLYYDIRKRLKIADDEERSDRTKKDNSLPSKRRLNFLPLKQKRQPKVNLFEDQHKARELLEDNQDVLKQLEDRCRLFKKAMNNLTVDEEWTLAQTMFGITTYYRRESDGSLSIKLEGSLNGVPLFDQVAVLREIDLHYKWAPFCSSSLTIKHLNKLDTVGWFCVGLPNFGFMRDGCFRAIGCDSIHEDGNVLLVAQGIQDRAEDGVVCTHLESSAAAAAVTPESNPTPTSKSATSTAKDRTTFDSSKDNEEKHLFDFLSKDPVLETLDIPPPPTRMGSGRMTIRTFQALISIESPTEAKSKLVTNVDPNLPLIPQSLIDFLMKRLCGVLLAKMQSAAKKISKDPVTNLHAIKMREDRDFYEQWLLPKFQGVCRMRGWDMPPISSFELSEAQLDLANAIAVKTSHRNMKRTKRYHSMDDDENLDRYLGTSELTSFAETAPAIVGQRSNSDRGPLLKSMSCDSDDLSDLSRGSSSASSFFRNNPISNYLREIEERTLLRKAREVEESRQRAENRLKPKELDEQSRSRLDELRIARNRRSPTSLKHGSSGGGTEPNSDTVEIASQDYRVTIDTQRDWAVFWTQHGPITRTMVVLALTGSLFGILYLDIPMDEFVTHDKKMFWKSTLEDIAVLFHLGIAGLAHFFLCYVAFMYAFSALQVGAITGNEAKKFYSRNVHLIVAMASASMITAGLIKTMLLSLVQWSARIIYSLLVIVGKYIPPLPDIIVSSVKALVASAMSILSSTETLILESNIVGRTTVKLFKMLLTPLRSTVSIWFTFLKSALDEYQGNLRLYSWREDVFVTTRALFSYSAVFLLVLLLVFNISAKRARHEERHPDTSNHQGMNSEDNESKEMTASAITKNRLQHYSRSLSPAFDTIEEEDMLSDARESACLRPRQ